MNTAVFVAVISATASIFVAAMSFLFTKHREREADWRRDKLQHYRELMIAVSGIVKEHSSPANQRRFADACNVVGLVASQEVVKSLQDFQEIIKASRPCPTVEEHDKALTSLVLSLRRDLRLSPKDDIRTFRYRLWAGGPS